MPLELARLKEALADRYTVEQEVGSGGMATVFLAEDLKHHRKVAIKVLHPELAAAVGTDRFLREIETVAGLTHPHILPLHDSGENDGLMFYVMPYVEGESLRQRLDREKQLPVEDAIRIAEEVAGALDHAHRNGVIHRDIKPENILLEERHAVVADFGIARAIDKAGGLKVTATGMAVGTPAYMSPEQAAGEAADQRSDIYALGCVTYEMLAGEPPFAGATPQAVQAHRLIDTPTSLSMLRDTVPNALDAVVRKTLAKAPADRYRSAREFSDALRSLAGAGVGDPPRSGKASSGRAGRRRAIRWAAVAAAAVVLAVAVWRQPGIAPDRTGADLASIAVLPFATRTAVEADQYFAEGVHDDLITQLSNIDSLKVISRTSVMQYRDTDKTVRQIGEELGVATVVEGGVQRAGDRVRVNMRLIDTGTDQQMWSEKYDEELTPANIFLIQSDLTRKISRALETTLTPEVEERLEGRPTESLRAYDLYARGRYVYHKGITRENLEGAVQLFQESIDADPDYAQAYVGLALAHLWLSYQGYWPGEEALPLASAAVEKALQLDETLGEAHSARGWLLAIERDFPESEREHRRALDLNPGSALAHNRYSNLLLALGRFEESVREGSRAVELDPLSVVYRRQMIGSLLYASDYDAVLEEARKLIELEPDDDGAYYFLASAYKELGEYDDAVVAMEKAIELDPDEPYNPPMLAYIHAQAGDRDAALRVLEQAEALGVRAPLKEIALVYGALGELDRAFEYLDRAYEEERESLYYLKSDGSAKPLHSDPRWGELLRKLGLE